MLAWNTSLNASLAILEAKLFSNVSNKFFNMIWTRAVYAEDDNAQSVFGWNSDAMAARLLKQVSYDLE